MVLSHLEVVCGDSCKIRRSLEEKVHGWQSSRERTGWAWELEAQTSKLEQGVQMFEAQTFVLGSRECIVVKRESSNVVYIMDVFVVCSIALTQKIDAAERHPPPIATSTKRKATMLQVYTLKPRD